jgi:sugar phosphate isomerase/epimerase
MDVGHTLRAGVDPIAAAKDAGPRLLDMHTKDVREESDGKWKSVDMGQGTVPVAALFRYLQKTHYAGHCNLEYEVGSADPLPGINRCFAYMEGVLAGLTA